MLTGLEQYSLERAGYFIRRAAVPNGDVCEGLAGILNHVAETVESALGHGPIAIYHGCDDGQLGWHRGFDIGWDLPPVEQIGVLARTMEHLQVRTAVMPDESLALLPGTHSAPPAPEDLEQLRLDPTADTPGMVRVRLAPGDALFWNTNVVHRELTSSRDDNVFCVTFVSRECPKPTWAGESLDSLEKDLR